MDGSSPDSKLVRAKGIPDKLALMLAQITSDDRDYLETLVRTALQLREKVDIADLWRKEELASTYWILLLTGIHQDEEIKVAQDLIFWKTFVAKDSALVRCVQNSERRDYRCCSSRFQIVNCPTLVFSDSPNMESFVKVDAGLLFALAAQPGNLQRFFTRLHSLAENGSALEEIQSALVSDRFWAALRIVYTDVKSLVSFSFGAKL